MARLSDAEFAIQKQINPILTSMAWAVRNKMREQFSATFDRPKAWTLNGLEVIPANTKNDNSATVMIKTDKQKGTPPINVLGHHFTGGRRPNTNLEIALQQKGWLPRGWYVVPTSFCPVDSNGNVKPGHVNKIMTYLELHWKSGYNANSNRKTRDKQRKKESGGWFVVQHSGAGGKQEKRNLKAGIYFRNYTNNVAIPEFRFYRSLKPYQKSFDFHETFEQIKGPYIDKLNDAVVDAMTKQLVRAIKDGAAFAKGKIKIV